MKIKELRKAHGLTQRELSELTGIPSRTIEDWEAGRREPPEYVIKLLEFFLNNMGDA